MKKSAKFEMFIETKAYIDKYHSGNPMDFVTNIYIFYYLSGRFPSASMRDCCALVEALRTHYMCEFSDMEDLSCDDDELPFN